MTTTICFGIQKGGCSKTTTSGVFVHQLANDGKRVLAIDMDCQGNLTEMLTKQSANEFDERTVLEAIRENDAAKYIVQVTDNIDVLPANNLLALLPRFLYQTHGFNNAEAIYTALDNMLKPVKEAYDFIVIDTPPALSEHTINSFVTSDYVVVMFESSNWCYSAIPNFMETVELAKQLNPDLKIAGILRTLNDIRRYDSRAFNELIAEDYPDLVFETVIRRKAATGRLALHGFESNNELTDALDQYESFYKELMERCQVKLTN